MKIFHFEHRLIIPTTTISLNYTYKQTRILQFLKTKTNSNLTSLRKFEKQERQKQNPSERAREREFTDGEERTGSIVVLENDRCGAT
jgi:hypothetical protein